MRDELEPAVPRVAEEPGGEDHGCQDGDAEEVGGQPVLQRVVDVIDIRRHQREPHVVRTGTHHEGHDHRRDGDSERAAHEDRSTASGVAPDTTA